MTTMTFGALTHPLRDAIETLRLAHRIYRSEPVTIRMFGDERVRAVYTVFTAGHPLAPWVERNAFGAALIDLRDKDSVHFSGTGAHFQHRRNRLRRALKHGYYFQPIEPLRHLDEILAINRSAELRQGRPLTRVYLDPVQIRKAAEEERCSFGVFDKDHVLRAYAHTPILGDAFAFSYLLGHREHLEHGIMYLLVQQVLAAMSEHDRAHGFPRWAFYDMFLGAKPGLRQFKYQVGFKPYRVQWKWVDCSDV